MELLHIILDAVCVLLAAPFAVTLGRHGRALVYPLCMTACAVLLGTDTFALLSAVSSNTMSLHLGLPDVGIHLRLDTLSAFFGIVVNLGAVLASLYGIGYSRHEPRPLRILPFYPIFLASMNLVLVADDAFTFLMVWELMSLTSWALVVAHHQDARNRQAAYIYLLMANLGTVALLFTFGLLADTHGEYTFNAMHSVTRPALITGLALMMALIGAGSKAGIVPLHIWLPLAHPAAPSHVSALMSGVMTKVAIYVIVRIMFDLCAPLSWGWSVPLLVAGGLTAVMGILYALMQSDIKKILAYSTVENVGIILIGLGLAFAFRASHMNAAAAIAMTAALLHIFNHSLFKSLLFLGAGSVVHATGHRSIERMGGLIHRMPVTAALFLVGCAAIAALPPLNGFVSEWMTFQAILASPDLPQPALRFLVPVIGITLVLAAALAATCFVRLYGIAFLGRPRSEKATLAHETDSFARTAMTILATLCLLAGLFATVLVKALGPLSLKLTGNALPMAHAYALFSLSPFVSGRSSYNAALLLLFLLLSLAVTFLFIRLFASRRCRTIAAWDCGFPDASPLTQYTASGFSQPLRRIFGTFVFQAREEALMPLPGETAPAMFRVHMIDPVWQSLYAPVTKSVLYLADRLNALQFLTIRGYLALVFLTLVSLLAVVALWS